MNFNSGGIRLDFHAVRLLVNDFQRSLTFYQEVLGFSGWYDEKQEYAYFEEKQIALFSRTRMNKVFNQDCKDLENDSTYKHLIQFEVENVDQMFLNLRAKGVVFLNDPHNQTDWGSRVVHFTDPDGNLIELYQSIRE